MKKGATSSAYDLDGAKAIFTSGGNALRVEHPDGPDSWFWFDRDEGEFVLVRDRESHVGTVDEDDIVRIANRPENEWSTVPVDESPVDEGAIA